MIDVLVLGGVGVDTIVRVPSLSVPPGDSLGVGPIIDYVAHSGNGVALGFHALGLRTSFVDFLGDDPAGALIRARYAEVGLEFHTRPAPNGTPRAVNLVDDEGRRFSFFDGRHPAGLVLPEDAYLPLLRQARHVHVAAGFAAGAFAHAREHGLTTSTDIHAWDGEHPYALPMVGEADLVFLSAAGTPGRTDDLMRRILDLGRASAVVATDGAAGGLVLTKDDPQVRTYTAATPEAPVVDSNGAGDAFSTAFMSRWLAGAPIDECVRAGAVSGAFAATVPGTHERHITAPELTAALSRTR